MAHRGWRDFRCQKFLMSERYLKDLQMEIPQVDKFYGKFNWNELLADLGKAYH